MPRFEPVINQFIVPDDPYTIAAAPPKPKRSSSHNINPRCSQKRKGSISALERLSVFAEATQRVKRRLRNVIAGAVGASAGHPTRRKNRDAMNVDYVWNGYFDPVGFPIGPPFDAPIPREKLPNYAPVINRYSVNMEERSISDVSMYFGESDDQAESAPTPRATTPEPSTPAATPKKQLEKEVEAKKEDAEDDDDEAGSEDEDSHETEKKPSSPRKSPKKRSVEDTPKGPSKTADDAVSILTPMDEDPAEESPSTPKAAAPASVPVIKTPKPPRRRSGSGSSQASDDAAPLSAIRLTSKDKLPTRNPRLTLNTNLNRTPIKSEGKVLTGLVGQITTSPQGLCLELGPQDLHNFDESDLMEIILPSALNDEAAPPYTLNQNSSEEQTEDATVRAKPTLLPAVELSEKKPTRRSSRDSDTTIVGSPKPATPFPDEKAGAKDDLARSLDTPTTIRAKIDSLPLEHSDYTPMNQTPTFRFWPASPLANRNNEDHVRTLHWARRPVDAQ